MATTFLPPKLNYLFILLLISTFPQYFSQSNPQNIQTYYQLSPPGTSLHIFPPPNTPISTPQQPSTRSRAKSKVGKTIGVIAATTLVLSGLIFFIVLRRTRQKRKRDSVALTKIRDNNPIMAYQNDSFTRMEGNLKGLIVDENGLDVLYWRRLEEGVNMTSFKKQYYHNMNDKQKDEEKRVISDRGKSHRPPIQEVPLLRGSSTFQSIVSEEKQEDVIAKAPSSSLSVPSNKNSLRYNGDLMEALFGYVATNKKSPKRDDTSPSRGVPHSQIIILDPHKSEYTAIMLKSLGITRKEITDALVGGRDLNRDIIVQLTRITPTDKESSEILAFNGDLTRLSYAESFLYHLLKVIPSAFTRFNLMLLRSNYESEVSHMKVSLKSIESACEELKNKGIFLKLMESVLKAGNRLKGNAQNFKLKDLKKISNVRSTDGKTTLLQFVVMELIRSEGRRVFLNKIRKTSDKCISKDDREIEYMMLGLPVIGGLSGEFLNVRKSALLDYDYLFKTNVMLLELVLETQKLLPKCGPGGFSREMKSFIDSAESEIKTVKEEQTRVMDLVRKILDYYEAGSIIMDKGEKNFLEIFVIVRDFLGMVDQACIDIARNVQKRRVDVGSSSPVFQTIFRFHKLPADFMSDT